MSYHSSPSTFSFSNWNGSIAVDASGTITITVGNGATVTTTQTNFPANTTEGTETLTVDVNVVVPSGYLNSGSTVTGQVTVTQPTSYTSPSPESCPSPIAVNGYYPLYTTITCAQQHTGGNGDYHSHELNGITYYMPNGLNMDSSNGPITQWHGDYLSESKDDTSTKEGTTSTSIKRGRVPIPKSQEEISNSFVQPYDKLGRGNPNTPTTLNRGEQTSMKNDTTKPFSLGIQDIDEAIFYYFNNVIKPSVVQNGQRIAVPVRYGNEERWKDVQRDGYLRDDKGKLMAPLILVKRNTIKSETTLSKIDANRLHNFEYFQKQYSKQNAYDKFNILNNSKPTRELYAVVIPDFVTITYSCIMYTYYIDQLNKLVEAVNFANNGYWGDPERFKFNTLIDSFNIETNTPDSDQRTVRANFDLTLKGYLIPDVIQKDLISAKKTYSPSKIVVSQETTITDPRQLNL